MQSYLRSQSLALAALGLGIVATLTAWFFAAAQAQREAQAQFLTRATVAASALERRLQRYVDILHGLEALAYPNRHLSRGEFRDYVAALELARRFPGVQAVGFVRRVDAAQRDEFVDHMRSDRSVASGYADFDIRPPGRRDEYWVVELLEPAEGNREAIGLDIRTRPQASIAAERAYHSGEAALTSPFRLVRDKGTSDGMVMYLPLFTRDAGNSADSRRAALRGFVNVVLRVDDMFAALRAEPAVGTLRMRIDDAGFPGQREGRKVETILDSLATPANLELNPPWERWAPVATKQLFAAGREWNLRFEDEAGLHPGLRRFPLLALVAGFGMTFLLYGILRANARVSNERLRAVIEAAPNAIIARDLEARITIWNPAAERMFGWTEEEVLGTSTSVVPQYLVDETRRLRQAAERGETIWIEETQRMHRDGHLVDVSMSVAPVQGADGTVNGTMVTIADISRRKQAEQALRESESHLRLAMEAAQMGMWYWECDTDRFTYSPGLNVLFGRPADSPHVDYRDLQRNLHPDDRDLFDVALRHAIKQGNDFQVDYRVVWPNGSVQWVANRAQVFRGANGRAARVVGVAMNITDRKIAEQRIAHMAHHDALTGLPNRTLLRDRIQQAIAQAHRAEVQVAVLFLDLDRFKTINDSLGHQLGDRLLQSVASRILVCVREGDTVARVGGDEFVIVIPALGTSTDASAVGSKILEVLGSAFQLQGHDLHVAASIGISLYPNDGADAETLLRNADTAMYHAKDLGRGNYQFFTQHMNVAAQQRLKLDTSMRRALEWREFELHYQPVYDLRDRSIIACEALLRWRPRGGNTVTPGEFITAAEDSGLIVQIGEWVLREALKQAKTWQTDERRVAIAINVSAKQLARSNFTALLRDLIQEAGIDPELVELEVTESVIIEGAGEARDALDQIAALGVGIAIDDFGTGYSGLAYLKRLPIDTVKIDQSFVRDLTIDPDDAAIVTAIVAMSKSLGLHVIAEGVETAEQLAELQRLGCQRAQGFLLARPMTGADIAKLLKEKTNKGVRVEYSK